MAEEQIPAKVTPVLSQKDIRIAAKAAIWNHLQEHGRKGLSKLQAEFGASRSSFNRWVDQVEQGPPPADALADAVKVAKVAAARSNSHIPVAPSPAVLAAGGKKTMTAMSILAHIEEIFTDIALLRDFSMKDDGKGGREIKNPMYFSKAIQLRTSAVRETLAAYERVYDLRRLMQFYEIITSEIAAADPEMAHRVMERLAALDDATGMTVNAQPRLTHATVE